MKALSIILLLLVLLTSFFAISNPAFAVLGGDDPSDRMLEDPGTNDGTSKTSIEQSKKKQIIDTKNFLYNFFSSIQATPGSNNTNTPSPGTNISPTPGSLTPIPSQSPGGLPYSKSLAVLQGLYITVGNKVGVPPCVIDAVSYIEYPSINNFGEGVIQQAMQPGQVIPNCPLNLCSAAGHMQMTTGVDERGDSTCPRCGAGYCPNAWSGYGNAIQKYESASHQGNVCNIRDATYGAAAKLKHDSGTTEGDMIWTHDNYVAAGRSYYGECRSKYARLGDRTYCEFVEYNCSL